MKILLIYLDNSQAWWVLVLISVHDDVDASI